MSKNRTPYCPKCKSDQVIPIVYGSPTEDVMKMEEEGKVKLGGCVMYERNPNWSCKDCGMDW